MIKYILKGHKPVKVEDVLEWEKWFETADRVVKQETLSDGKFVSTVFLGLDYNFRTIGKPLLFETMVFNEEGNYTDLDVDRYPTWEEAEKGHTNMVAKWKGQ